MYDMPFYIWREMHIFIWCRQHTILVSSSRLPCSNVISCIWHTCMVILWCCQVLLSFVLSSSDIKCHVRYCNLPLCVRRYSLCTLDFILHSDPPFPQALMARHYQPTFVFNFLFTYLFSLTRSLLCHLFFLNVTCSCPYSYNLILTSTYMRIIRVYRGGHM